MRARLVNAAWRQGPGGAGAAGERPDEALGGLGAAAGDALLPAALAWAAAPPDAAAQPASAAAAWSPRTVVRVQRPCRWAALPRPVAPAPRAAGSNRLRATRRYFHTGFCRDGEACRFAHGGAEAAARPPRASTPPPPPLAAAGFAFGAPGSEAFADGALRLAPPRAAGAAPGPDADLARRSDLAPTARPFLPMGL